MKDKNINWYHILGIIVTIGYIFYILIAFAEVDSGDKTLFLAYMLGSIFVILPFWSLGEIIGLLRSINDRLGNISIPGTTNIVTNNTIEKENEQVETTINEDEESEEIPWELQEDENIEDTNK